MAEDVRVLKDDDLREATGTPGIHRRVAVEDEGYWFGHVRTDPDSLSGWHHHGENVTVGYVLRGHTRIEFGPGGDEKVDVGPGEYFVVPAQLVHREGNLTDQDGEIVLVRVGEGPPVFPVDGPDAE